MFPCRTKSFKQLMDEAETPARSKPLPPAVASPGGEAANGAAIATAGSGPLGGGGALAAAAPPLSSEPLVRALQQLQQASQRTAELGAAHAAAALQSGGAAEVESGRAALQQ